MQFGVLLAIAISPLNAESAAIAAYRLPCVMGRDYWTVLRSGPLSDPAVSLSPEWDVQELKSLPLFRDCALVRIGGESPKSGRPTPETVRENYDRRSWDAFENDAKRDKPVFAVMTNKRRIRASVGKPKLDFAEYAAWTNRHPNLFAVRTMAEWDNDILLHRESAPKEKDSVLREAYMKTWGNVPTNRYERLAEARRWFDREVELHYGDMRLCEAFRACLSLDHVAAAWGAKFLVLETTDTAMAPKEYRWDVAGMFIRGAARQFDVPWGWYVASFRNGWGKDGKWHNNTFCSTTVDHPIFKPEGGISTSLLSRVCHYAYLNGATFVEPEEWTYNFTRRRASDGKMELAPYGKAFSDYHDFTAAHPDRGVPYAPVAILVPFAQGYPAYGGLPWNDIRIPYLPGDYAVDAVFFTLVPPPEDHEARSKRGVEFNLHDTRFAMMYDVLVPDSPQPKDRFLDVLGNYKAAVVVGEYVDKSFLSALDAYRRGGGEVVTVDSAQLTPMRKGEWACYDVLSGKKTFPMLQRTFDDLQRRHFPVEVAGRCLYGLNRTKRGWWLWCLNNAGVLKFADDYEKVDRSFDSTVRVSLRDVRAKRVTELKSGRIVDVEGGRFDWIIPAGGLVVFEIEE